MIKSIRVKLLIWFLCFSLINIIIAVISIFYIHQKEDIEQLINQVQDLEVLLYKDANSISAFYLNEVDNPLFYYTKFSYNIQEHNVYIAEVQNKIYSILSLNAISKFKLKDHLYKIKSETDSIKSNFDTIIKLIIEKGYGKYGLINSLNENTLKISNLCNNELDKEILKTIINYSVNRDSFYQSLCRYYSVPIEKQDLLKQYAAKYYFIYHKILNLDKAIGIKSEDGLKSLLENRIYQTSSLLDLMIKETNDRKNHIFIQYRNSYITSVFILFIIGFFLSFYSSKRNTKRIEVLSDNISKFIQHKFSKTEIINFDGKDDEVGKLIINFNVLQNEIVKHIINLEELVKERTLKIEEQNFEILSQNEEVMRQKEYMARQNSRILDSIKYAKKIQEAVMPDEQYLNSVFSESFLFQLPKSVVSGDFFWIKNVQTKVKKLTYFAVADCTGHGVPGAFMSMLGISYLNEIISMATYQKASSILEELRKKIIENLQDNSKSVSDGMDIAICIYNNDTKKLNYSGSYRSLILIRNNELLEFNSNKIPIGKHYKLDQNFSCIDIELNSGDQIYLTTDGYVDQINEKSIKYTKTRFNEMLLQIGNQPMKQQKQNVENTLEKWMGYKDQTDDIMVLGIKF